MDRLSPLDALFVDAFRAVDLLGEDDRDPRETGGLKQAGDVARSRVRTEDDNRHVDRLGTSAQPAEDLFAGVVAMIETSDTFCIVHEPGPMLLAGKLRTAPRRADV